ncbi:MAG TPA: amidohydrolase family protein [Anaerovoracaceae bacterium]|nr:amidohydrolase family protein [Anaerovoracaceae bacterium]
MIVDCHTHIGRNNHIDCSVDRLLKSMDEAKIDKSLVFAGKLNAASNEWMLEQIAPHKDRLIGVAAAHPLEHGETFHQTEEAKRIVDWFGEGKIVACKFYVGYDHYMPVDANNYLWRLEVVGCPAIFHSGDCLNSVHSAKLKYAHPLHIDDVAVDYPNMKFVIAHMGYPFQREAAEVCYKNANVFADVSGFVYGDFDAKSMGHFDRVIGEFIEIAGGTDKLLFGTDSPISNQKSYVWTMKKYLPVFENYQKVFRL